VLWIYFWGGHTKGGLEWWPRGHFAALAQVMSDPHVARFHAAWVSSIYPLLQLMTFCTMCFELGAPAMLLWTWLGRRGDRLGQVSRGLRWLWLSLGIAFHLGIAIFLNLGIFPFGMLSFYPVFLRPDELSRAEAWIRRRWWRTT
jgi:hypothetical protein